MTHSVLVVVNGQTLSRTYCNSLYLVHFELDTANWPVDRNVSQRGSTLRSEYPTFLQMFHVKQIYPLTAFLEDLNEAAPLLHQHMVGQGREI